MRTSTDVIEKQVLLRATIARVWAAVGDAEQFGRWFGARFDEPFVAGARLIATLVPTEVDPEIAAYQEPYRGRTFPITIQRVEPPHHLSFRWHPGELPDDTDVSSEPTTLVEFDLEEVPEGTMLTIRESGFDSVPLERRAKAFSDNEEGWEAQASLIAKYLELA